MKKLTGWLLVFMLGITACKGPMGPAGKDAEETNWFADNFEVLASHWKPATEEGDGYFFHYWEYEFSIPQLTNFVFNEGYVGCSLIQVIEYDNGRTSTVQRPLPYTIYGIDNDFPYSENYSFEIRPGYIKFIVKYSDFSELQPLTCTFRVVMIW